MIELTKSEALELMNAELCYQMAAKARLDLIQRLYGQYGLVPDTHDLNFRLGVFQIKGGEPSQTD